MKKILIIAAILLGLVIFVIYYAFFDMGRLPKGELIAEAQSPDGTYTVKAYIVNGGATVSNAVRGELDFNKKNKKPKNIYWNYREENAVIEWIDNDTVVINGHEIDVPDGKFDFRRNR